MSWLLSKKYLFVSRSEIHLVRCNIVSTGQSVRDFKKIIFRLAYVTEKRKTAVVYMLINLGLHARLRVYLFGTMDEWPIDSSDPRNPFPNKQNCMIQVIHTILLLKIFFYLPRLCRPALWIFDQVIFKFLGITGTITKITNNVRSEHHISWLLCLFKFFRWNCLQYILQLWFLDSPYLN